MFDGEYIKLRLSEGEGFKVEFKEKLASLDREIVAFANASGGEIYIGVDDYGNIKGINITNALKSQIYDIARNCDPSINIELQECAALRLLVVIVEEGENKPYKSKDGFFLRMGPNAQKLKRDEIIQFINDVGKVHFDESINQRFNFQKDFSEELLDDYLKRCGISARLPAQDILLSLNAAQKNNGILNVTNAGALFFAKDPRAFFPEAYVTAVKYKTNDRHLILDKKEFSGNLVSQIEESLAFVMRHINMSVEFNYLQARRYEIYEYPPIALREAITNAITHRDYLYDGAHIYIHIYPNHIDIENPGGLYHGLAIDDLGKRSVRRNRLIADLLHRSGYIERVGSGFDRMKIALKDNANPELEVTATNFFNIRFVKRAKNYNLQLLSKRQLALYQDFLVRKTMTKKEVSASMHISEDTALRDIKVLIDQGLLVKEGVGRSTCYLLSGVNVDE